MKKFDYRYSILQTGALTNSDGTNIKKRSNGGIEIYDNSWDQYLEDAIVPEITYTTTNATSVDKTVKAWTFYCDSLSGCVSGTEHYADGDGSKENPWRSVPYAISKIYSKFLCTKGVYCCQDIRFQLKLKGIIDYEFQNISADFYYKNKQCLIIAPWDDNEYVILQPSETHRGARWHYIHGIIYNNFKLQTHAYFYECRNSIFNHFLCNVTDPDVYGIFKSPTGSKFIDFNCIDSYSIFYECHGCDIIDLTTNMSLSGHDSNFCNIYNVLVNNYNDEDITLWETTIAGIHGFESSNFYNCTVNVIPHFEVTNYVASYIGFLAMYYSNFYNCVANIVVDNQYAVYTSQVLTGFAGNYHSVFNNCVATLSGTLHCQFWSDKYFGIVDSCGFYGNGYSTFYNCTTTNSCQKCADETQTCRTPDF